MKTITIKFEQDRTIFGTPTGATFGTIDFWEANNGWVDRRIFHQIINNRYVPSTLGKKAGIKESRNGGSAFLEFNPSKIALVKKSLTQAGYQVIIKK